MEIKFLLLEVGLNNYKKKVHQKYIDYLSKQAKDDKINFIHNDVGYNLHISNLHSAIGCAQIVNLKKILIKKIDL